MPDTLLFKSSIDRAEWWRAELKSRLPDLAMRVWPQVGDVADIDFALVWKPKPGDLARYPNLRAIFSLGAGVDHLFSDPGLPPDVPICRVVDAALTAGMTEYVLLAVLRHHRDAPAYQRRQRAGKWQGLPFRQAFERSVGIMGLGVLGTDAANHLVALGFKVNGWSRTPKDLPGVTSFHGGDGLRPFLQNSEILVCLLPLTAETDGILNRRTFADLPRGAYLINAARGAHLVEQDLIPALDAGQLAGAALDVFRAEPLPDGHPFWGDERIIITPHIASMSGPRTVADQVAENINRARAGAPLLHVVDKRLGY